MSRGLPAPLRNEPPDVVVVRPPTPVEPRRQGNALARLALSLTPDLIEALDRALAQRRLLADQRAVSTLRAREPHAHTRAVQYSEVEINTWAPFPRRVRMATTTRWETSEPVAYEIVTEEHPRPSRLRRAGVVGIGGAVALATLGVLANRGGRLRRR